jgi:hypothetical protein
MRGCVAREPPPPGSLGHSGVGRLRYNGELTAAASDP